MAKQFFVLGIGGTGMRCIESLIHLCAMGMFDNTDIHLLALDTDKNNGNFSRLKEVKEAYVKAKGVEASSRVALQDTFFSANIKYYEFSPNYEHKSTFKAVFDYSNTSNPQPIGFSGILLAKRQNSFYRTYFLHNRNVADTKSPYPIKRLEVIRWFNQKSMVFNQSLS